MEFTEPQVILFVADCERAADFYRNLGFTETFRAPGTPSAKIEMRQNGFTLGLARPEAAATEHGLAPVSTGQRACITLWTDDLDAGYSLALAVGARHLHGPHRFGDRLRVAFVEDPDGHPVQLVQRATRPNPSGPNRHQAPDRTCTEPPPAP